MIDLVLDTIIPGDASLGMPAASVIDFEAYQLRYQLQRLVDDFLAELSTLSLDKYGVEFIKLTEEQRLSTINSCRTKNIRLFTTFLTHCFRAYYSDRSILDCLSAGSVPPFPIGNVLEQDDWTLLEPVYERGPIYRSVHEV